MKSQLAVLLILVLTAFLIWGCSEQQVNGPNDTNAGKNGIIQLSHTEGEPFLVPLIAGQNMEVGVIEVWNDLSNLHVKYVITDPDWCLTETQLHVSTDPDLIPQHNGNPAPGQFDYKDEHDCLSEFEYSIPLVVGEPVKPKDPPPHTWECDDDLFIAAHAVVVRLIEDCWETVWQIGDVEQPVVYPDGPYASMTLLTNYADEFNWNYPEELTGKEYYNAGYTLAQDEPSFTNPFIVGTTPTSEFPYNSNYNREYATDFDVEWDGSLPFGGRLIFSWSPGQSAAETKVITNGGTTVVNRTGTATPGMGYFLDTYPVYEESPIAIGTYEPGTHTINFSHTKGDGTFWDWIRLEQPCVQEETAWGAGQGFEGSNWAMYFEYAIQCEDGGGGSCETAFAYGGDDNDCFQNFGFSRWGWSNGPLAAQSSSYSFPIYAGAGQCVISNGTLVGTLTINYDGATATITYNMDTGYTMDETHLFVGDYRFPLKNSVPTVAPGQYPDQHNLSDATSDTYTVNGLSGDIYVIAHAVVCAQSE